MSDPTARWPSEAQLVSWTWNATAMVFHLVVVNGVLISLWLGGGEYLLHRRLVGNHPGYSLTLGAVVGFAGALVARLPTLRPMWAALAQRSSPPSVSGRVLVAAVGAVAEELLFRGVLQHSAGAPAATLLFAATHVPSERALRIWPVVGLATGAVLAWLHHEGGGVLGPIVAHLVWEVAGRTAPVRPTG